MRGAEGEAEDSTRHGQQSSDRRAEANKRQPVKVWCMLSWAACSAQRCRRVLRRLGQLCVLNTPPHLLGCCPPAFIKVAHQVRRQIAGKLPAASGEQQTHEMGDDTQRDAHTVQGGAVACWRTMCRGFRPSSAPCTRQPGPGCPGWHGCPAAPPPRGSQPLHLHPLLPLHCFQAPRLLLLLLQVHSWRQEVAATVPLPQGRRKLLALLFCMASLDVMEALLLRADAACARLQRQPQKGPA